IIFSCKQRENNNLIVENDTTIKETISPVTGNDRDEHGCIGSAGYTWSEIKKECVQLFTSAVRLIEFNVDDTSGTSAFLIFSNDEKKAELFLPETTHSLILNLQGEEGNESWVDGNYKIYYWKGGYIVEKDNKQIFAGHPGN
ncbi:MAG TPA: hypothetical protein VM368_08600, partial [Flavisolibacter sp.]|nr:hypothetical protein [Flavisolibacter sp.]